MTRFEVTLIDVTSTRKLNQSNARRILGRSGTHQLAYILPKLTDLGFHDSARLGVAAQQSLKMGLSVFCSSSSVSETDSVIIVHI